MFCVAFRRYSTFCLIYHEQIVFYNRSGECRLGGTSRVLIAHKYVSSLESYCFLVMFKFVIHQTNMALTGPQITFTLKFQHSALSKSHLCFVPASCLWLAVRFQCWRQVATLEGKLSWQVLQKEEQTGSRLLIAGWEMSDVNNSSGLQMCSAQILHERQLCVLR